MKNEQWASMWDHIDDMRSTLLRSFIAICIGFICIIPFYQPIIQFILVHFGFLTADWLIAKRRYMIVFAFVAGAILTPPDVLTQLMLAIPLIAFYEAAIWYAKWKNARTFA